MPRPGFVLEVDRSTPPVLFWRGEGFSLEHLPPDRSRVIYAPEPLAPISDIDGAIRRALDDPIDADNGGVCDGFRFGRDDAERRSRRCCTTRSRTAATPTRARSW